MPPLARVCTACKASKVKCVGMTPGTKCNRCTRLGLVCEAVHQLSTIAPVAKQFAMPSSALYSEEAASKRQRTERAAPITLLSPMPPSALALSTQPPTQAELILHANKDSPAIEHFCLRHMAAIARQRNAYKLMTIVIRECQLRGIALNDVLAPVDEQELGPLSSFHPSETLRVMSASQGYAMCRTVSASGRNAFYTNPAFENEVISCAALEDCYARNEREVITLLIHPDDLPNVRTHMASTWRAAACSGGKLATENCGTVRLYNHRSVYVTCTLHVWMRIALQTGKVSIVLEFLPQNAITQALSEDNLLLLPVPVPSDEENASARIQEVFSPAACLPCEAEDEASSIDDAACPPMSDALLDSLTEDGALTIDDVNALIDAASSTGVPYHPCAG